MKAKNDANNRLAEAIAEVRRRVSKLEKSEALLRPDTAALSQQVNELSSLNEFSHKISSNLDRKQVVEIAGDQILRAVSADMALFYLRRGDSFTQESACSERRRFQRLLAGAERVGRCACEMVVLEGRPVYCKDILIDPRYTGKECTRVGFRSFAALTLCTKDALLGVVVITSVAERDFFDGDGKGDVAIWRSGTGVWYILPSGAPGTYTEMQWGIPTDIPVPGDYDGDGKDDIAVWRTGTSTWYIRPSSVPGTYTETQWGVSGDIAVPGDYDADGRTDIAVWRPGNGIWYILPSGTPGSFTSIQWGQASDKPVPADYDGDGKADVAVWRPGVGMWYIRPSGTPGSFIGTQWGISTDLPAGGDFDGDGKADVAVFKPSAGIWYVLPSAAPGTYTAVQWGQTADIPISGLTGILRQAP